MWFATCSQVPPSLGAHGQVQQHLQDRVLWAEEVESQFNRRDTPMWVNATSIGCTSCVVRIFELVKILCVIVVLPQEDVVHQPS